MGLARLEVISIEKETQNFKVVAPVLALGLRSAGPSIIFASHPGSEMVKVLTTQLE